MKVISLSEDDNGRKYYIVQAYWLINVPLLIIQTLKGSEKANYKY